MYERNPVGVPFTARGGEADPSRSAPWLPLAAATPGRRHPWPPASPWLLASPWPPSAAYAHMREASALPSVPLRALPGLRPGPVYGPARFTARPDPVRRRLACRASAGLPRVGWPAARRLACCASPRPPRCPLRTAGPLPAPPCPRCPPPAAPAARLAWTGAARYARRPRWPLRRCAMQRP